jgi:oligopeptide transport system substrate-binding protein
MRSPRKPGTQFLVSLLCLAVMLLLAGCGGNNSTTPPKGGKPAMAPKNQQVFRTPYTVSDLKSFDPAISTDLASIGAVDMVFTGLVAENDQLQVIPQLANDYSVSPDGLSYTFHLRANLKFSDGTPLTSADVAYSIDRALSPDVYNLNGISLTYLGLIKGAVDRSSGKIKTIIGTGIQTPDANTVVIYVTQPSAYFLEALTYPTSYVVEQKVIEQWGAKWTDHLSDNGGQGGAGPFVVQEYNHSTGITFIPNANYYGPKPLLQKVIVPFITDTQTNYLEYQSGQADETGIPSADNQQAMKLKDQFHAVPQLAINYYGLNYLVKPLDNIKIRQALELAINKDIIVQHVLGGQAIPTNHIIPSGMPGYNPNLTGPDGVTTTKGDTNKAKQLFAEGLQEEGMTLATFPTLKFTYSNANSDNANEVTTVIQMWQQVLGITTIKPDPVDRSTLFKEISNTTNNTSLAMWKGDWYADYPDPQDWITLQFDKGIAGNNQNYGQNHSSDAAQQQALQQQMEQADAMNDQTARMKAYNAIEQQLVNDVAWLPMQQVITTYLLKPYVIGIVDNAQGLTPPNDWGSIYIAQH